MIAEIAAEMANVLNPIGPTHNHFCLDWKVVIPVFYMGHVVDDGILV
jgi:hypothetical protein